MDNNEDILQQASLKILKTYPYLYYMLNIITENGGDAVIDTLPDNMLDYMMVDLEASRMDEFNVLYNNSGYYELSIGFTDRIIDYKFTYTFKISEQFKDVVNEWMETIFGETLDVGYQTNTIPKLTVLKGGKEDK